MNPQQTLAHYRIVSKLGAGGMGEVWRASDTKLGRDVAIKILPEAFANDSDRMARFTREARVLASLNHPNIAAIYGVEERALVMELVEGPTLAERIVQGPMPMEEVLEIARQIGDALEAAHDKGVVHRDLKPANIKITPEGRVKVLDFGLARAFASESSSSSTADSPTLTIAASTAGVILGTAGYMAPEQAKGKPVDKRADIWAFGVVLFEMLTGNPLFTGESVSDTLAAVLTKEPEWERVPAKVRRLLQSCLQKDAKRRLRDVGDAWQLLNHDGAVTQISPYRPTLPWIAITAVSVLAVAVLGVLLWRVTRPVEHSLTRLSVDLGPEAVPGLNLTAAISPDGRRLVFPARGPDGKQQLATRLLDQAQHTLLPGTEGGHEPFFSPDGQWVGFFAPGMLRKISVHGGAPVDLLSTIDNVGFGATWGEDGNIVATLSGLGTLWKVPAGGGVRQQLTKLGPGEISHRWAQVLPGGRAVLFTATPAAVNNASIQAISLETGKVRILLRGGYYGRYLPSGHLVYVREGVLFGVRFDPVRLEVRGAPTPLLDDMAANSANGSGRFDFSGTGTFVYAAGKSAAPAWQVASIDNSGTMHPLFAPATYLLPRLSPDGRNLAYARSGDIFVYNLERDTTTRLTFTGHASVPVWAPDSKHLVFQSVVNDTHFFYWTRSNGSGEPQRLLQGLGSSTPWAFSPDGRWLAYFERNAETGFDIWMLPLDITGRDRPTTGKPEVFLRTSADELAPRLSPDGRWIAYRSNESGNPEIFVRPFPAGSGGKWQISTGGGLYALWSNNGRELFYETADNRIMVMDYTVDGASFVPGKRRLWSERQLFYTGTSNLDLAPDGKRFVVLTLPDTAPGAKESVHVTMLLNFFDEVRRKLP